MTGNLYAYRRDPEGLGRGAGYYYHRGKGRFSKYNPERDLGLLAKTRLRHEQVGTMKRPGKRAHTGDEHHAGYRGNTPKYREGHAW